MSALSHKNFCHHFELKLHQNTEKEAAVKEAGYNAEHTIQKGKNIMQPMFKEIKYFQAMMEPRKILASCLASKSTTNKSRSKKRLGMCLLS